MNKKPKYSIGDKVYCWVNHMHVTDKVAEPCFISSVAEGFHEDSFVYTFKHSPGIVLSEEYVYAELNEILDVNIDIIKKKILTNIHEIKKLRKMKI